MCSKNVRTKHINYRIGRDVNRARGVEEQNGLGRREFLSLGASGAIDPTGEARKAVDGVDLWKTGVVRRRRRRRRTDLREPVEPVRSGAADSRVSDLGERAGL